MKNRNGLLLLGALLASASLAACSSSMDTKGKGIVQLMNDNQERVFYSVIDSNDDALPGKDERINYLYITKGGKLNGYEIGGGTVGAAVELHMDEVVGKNINEVRKLAEERSKRSFEIDKVKAKATTDGSGNNTEKEEIKLYVNDENKPTYLTYVSLTSGQIRDKYYAGYIGYTNSLVSSGDLLITEVSKGNVIGFDKVDGEIVKEK